MRASFFPYLLALSLGAAVCSADTIKLKNGRTIVCDSARETGNHVEYNIGDNTYAIPKSSVESIAAGGGPLPSDSAPELPAPPAMETSSERLPDLTNQVVKNGAVVPDALVTLSNQGDNRIAAAAYYAAGRFEHLRGNTIRATEYMKEAVGYDGQSPLILEHYATLLMATGRPADALTYAEQAVQIAPKSADALTVLGYALYRNDHNKAAIDAWKKALTLRPSAQVEAMVERAEREVAAEEGYSEQESSHFTLRYEGTKAPAELRRAILDTLEQHYMFLQEQFGEAPRQSVVVVLYPEQTYFDVTQAPSWSAAVNDGKLRIPLRGLDRVTGELSRVLRHELAHSFINSISRGRCPLWLHEGIAQLMEGRTLRNGLALSRSFSTGHYIPLNGLEGSFLNFSDQEAVLAYAEALAFVEYIHGTYGMSDLVRILQRIADGASTEAALRATVHAGYSEMETELTGYLKQRFGE
ncbi:MAG TPA: tetratricopeptide repeat protein [Terriglobales bacterium]|nr:tetratricopeptide repeat protein [Terriglobales bacterium]